MRAIGRARRGYTLSEMVAVTAILAMMSALVVPNLVTIHRSWMRHDVEMALTRLPVEARNFAVRQRCPMAIRILDEAVVLEPEMSGDVVSAGGNGPRREVRLNGGLTVVATLLGEESMDRDEWRWVVYPDGSAEEASIVFDAGREQRTLSLTASGAARWRDGDGDETRAEQWPAGEVEQSVMQP